MACSDEMTNDGGRLEAAERCAEISRLAGEPLAGSAPENAAWLLIEQAPPWGREALTESGLDASIGAELARRAKATGVKTALVRPRGASQPAAGGRRVVVFHAGACFVQTLRLGHDEQLLELDLARLARGQRPPGGVDVREPMTIVCTNGRRDACCAFHGPRAAEALARIRPEQTWECSHLGGHRFAATMVCLPTGACFGRLDPDAAVRAVSALERGVLELSHLRGIVGRPAAAQVAEALLREREGLDGIDDVQLVDVTPAPDADTVLVRLSAGGQEHAFQMARRAGEPRAISCGGEPEPSTSWALLR